MPVSTDAKATTARERKPRARRALAHQPEYRFLQVPVLEVRSGQGNASGLVEVAGQVIVYETPYEVYDMWGSFTETIHHGACTELLSRDMDVRFLFNHRDMPLARTGAQASLTLTDSTDALDVTALLDPRMSVANDLLVAIEQRLVTQMSIGMQVDPAGDVWSGEDDYGMPNVRNIYRLAGIFDASAVTFPASPTTSIDLAQRMWSGVPVASRERTRKLWSIAREARSGHSLSQRDSDALLHALEQLYVADGAMDERAAPTAEDPGIADKIAAAHAAVAAALAAQSKDPDNNTDPVDKKIWNALTGAQGFLTDALAAQASDGAPDKGAPEDKAGDTGDDDGTETGGAGNAPGVGSDDGTGSRSVPVTIGERREAAMSFGDQQSLVYQALVTHLGSGATDADGEVDIWIYDLAADWVVWHSYTTTGPGPGNWKLAYSLDADNQVTFSGDPLAVVEQTTWAPAPETNAADAPVDQRSTVDVDLDLLRLRRRPLAA